MRRRQKMRWSEKCFKTLFVPLVMFGVFVILSGGCSDDSAPGGSNAPMQTVSVLLPDTGQTTSYTAVFGEDSDYLINPPSFTKLNAEGEELQDAAAEWTMVRDNVTGLIWEVKTTDGSIHDKDNTYGWMGARVVYIDELNTKAFGGFTDWRLPYIRELSGLVNADHSRPAIDADYFPNTPIDGFTWSYDLYPRDSQRAYNVWFASGIILSLPFSRLGYVRAVRGKAAWEQDDYTDNGDGTVTDEYTGLMWQQEGPEETKTWEGALAHCEGLSLAGYDDWRLPNRNELQSLVDKQPDINSWVVINKAFPNTVPNLYWTSTHFEASELVWTVSFIDGLVAPAATPTDKFFIRAVRGGNQGS